MPRSTSRRDRDGIDDVDDQLHEQVEADALAGIAQRLGGAVQVAIADKPNEAIAQILPLEKHEMTTTMIRPAIRAG